MTPPPQTTTATTTTSITPTTAITPTAATTVRERMSKDTTHNFLKSDENSDNPTKIIKDEKKRQTPHGDFTQDKETIFAEPSRITNQNVSIKALSCHVNRMIAYLDVRNMKENFNIYLKISSCKFFVNTLNVVQGTIQFPINYHHCGTILKEHGSHSTYTNKLYFEKAVDDIRDERYFLTAKCHKKRTDKSGGTMHAKLKKAGDILSFRKKYNYNYF